MKNYLLPARVGGVVMGMLLCAACVSAQIDSERQELLRAFTASASKMPPAQRALLSSGMHRFMRYAAAVSAGGFSAEISDTPNGMVHAATRAQAASVAPRTAGPGGTTRVSNPGLDFVGTVLTGFAQNTTSSARCGNSVVVGYEDTGAVLRSNGSSLNGVSYSTDGGQSFTELAFLPPGPSPNILAGDPVVVCSSASRYYYASLLETAPSGGCPVPICPSAGISVSISTNGGKTWGNPVTAVATNSEYALDKPWLAVDPTNPMRLFLAYTDNGTGFSIRLVHSSDGGNTWSAPVVLDQERWGNPPNIVTGSNVVVAPEGNVYVAYEFFAGVSNGGGPRELRFTRSLDHGASFSAPVKVSDVVASGISAIQNIGFGELQGKFFVNEFPQLAVDRSNGPSRGNVYIAWSDGRNNIKPDAIGSTFMGGPGKYAYSDILVVKSTNQGQSFTAPAPISPAPGNFSGPGRDQFFPAIAVDNTGKVATCYYDRRNDRTNLAIDRYCSISLNHGSTWQDLRASSPAWLPIRADFLDPYSISEYDALTSDFLMQYSGFFGAFVIEEDGNPNIVAKKF